MNEVALEIVVSTLNAAIEGFRAGIAVAFDDDFFETAKKRSRIFFIIETWFKASLFKNKRGHSLAGL